MSLGEQRKKSQEMAKDLIARGFYHGKRQTSPSKNLPNPLSQRFVTESGSAAYRREMEKKQQHQR